MNHRAKVCNLRTDKMMKKFLVPGDALTILIITLIGFAMHGETNLSFLPRFAALYFSLSVSWFFLALGLGLFQDENLYNTRQLWRPALSAIFAAPLAAIVRGLILNASIIPIFAIVLSAMLAVGMILWRGLYLILNRKFL
jgi:hypothetical protein